jgi:hypothetical protein
VIAANTSATVEQVNATTLLLIAAFTGLTPNSDVASASTGGSENATASAKSKVKITPIASHSKAKVQIKVGGGKYKTVKNATIKLGKGKSRTVSIKVTAENGATKTYKLKVTRAKK